MTFRKRWRFSSSYHLYTLPGWEDDLHEFAIKVGLRRVWFQAASVMPHYDLTASRRSRAIALGAVEADRATLVDAIRTWSAERNRQTEEALTAQHQEDQRGRVILPDGEVESNRPLTDQEVAEAVARRGDSAAVEMNFYKHDAGRTK